MNQNEMATLIAQVECGVTFVTTGHDDYVRGYIKNGFVTLGRATIYKGEYSHTKWYSSDGGNLPLSYHVFACSQILSTGKVLTREMYFHLRDKAKEMQKAHRAEKQAWRDANPTTTKSKNGKLKTRRKLQGYSLSPILRRLIMEQLA